VNPAVLFLVGGVGLAVVLSAFVWLFSRPKKVVEDPNQARANLRALRHGAGGIGRPDCGAVVVFRGDARNHAEGRPEVTALGYEAYESQVVPRLGRLAGEARNRWPELGRIALIHRTGPLAIGEAAVVVAVSSPHRDTAFDAGRWCIDTLKETVPIWKSEAWAGGEDWGVDAQHVVEVPGSAPQDRPQGAV
jgi:molybdopterin synthase catalytic subunit